MIACPAFGDPPATPTPVSPQQKNLSEFARGHRLKGSGGDDSVPIVISDDNLSEMASSSELTSATQPQGGPGIPDEPDRMLDPKSYWRGRVQEQLEHNRELESRSQANRLEIGSLWELFYSCDEPEERENEIRPILTRLMEDQTELEGEIELGRSALQTLMTEAESVGGQSGWFRDLLKQPQ